MLDRFRSELKCTSQSSVFGDMWKLDVIHTSIQVFRSEEAQNANIRNINLVGTVFIDTVALFDDFRSKRFFVLPRNSDNVAKESLHLQKE